MTLKVIGAGFGRTGTNSTQNDAQPARLSMLPHVRSAREQGEQGPSRILAQGGHPLSA